MIARRFIAAFYPDAIFDVTQRTSVAAGHSFKTEGKILKFQGWLEVYEKGAANPEKQDDEESATLPELKDGENAKILDAQTKEEATKPPARYTEATLKTTSLRKQ